MTAGLATMQMLDEAAFERLERLGETVRGVIREAFAATGVAGQVTGIGAMLAVHMHTRPIHDYRSAFPTPEEAASLRALQLAMLKRGVLITARGAAYPPNVLSDDDLALLDRALRGALAEVAQHQHV
jgi:glutamate-1-semialdehyde 2,1-aminomutase